MKTSLKSPIVIAQKKCTCHVPSKHADYASPYVQYKTITNRQISCPDADTGRLSGSLSGNLRAAIVLTSGLTRAHQEVVSK